MSPSAWSGAGPGCAGSARWSTSCRSSPRTYTLITPPFGCSTPAVYRAWDELGGPRGANGNDLEPAALAVAPELAVWRDRIIDRTGIVPRLAGSGSTWFLEGAHDGPGWVVARTIAAVGAARPIESRRPRCRTVAAPLALPVLWVHSSRSAGSECARRSTARCSSAPVSNAAPAASSRYAPPPSTPGRRRRPRRPPGRRSTAATSTTTALPARTRPPTRTRRHRPPVVWDPVLPHPVGPPACGSAHRPERDGR